VYASILAVTRQPGADAQELAVVLQDLAWMLPRTIGLAELQREGVLPSELEVMRLLVRRPGLSVGAVADELSMHAPNVSTAIRALVARGLLERRRDDLDGRVTRLFPTSRAIAIRNRREQAWGDALAETLAELPADEAAALLGTAPLLRRLADLLGGPASQSRSSASAAALNPASAAPAMKLGELDASAPA
jgi:DNA-binding MarR family transcriptional regulator